MRHLVYPLISADRLSARVSGNEASQTVTMGPPRTFRLVCRFLARRLAHVDPLPARAKERLGLALRHLDRAVGCDVQVEHVHSADALWNAQTHPTLARGLLPAQLLGPHSVKVEDPRVGA